VLVAVVAIALVAVALVKSDRPSDEIPTVPTVPTGPAGPEGTRQVAVSSDVFHVPLDPPVDYSVEPPAGGDHFKVFQNCGIYDEPLTDEYVVHSMEHGAVWVTYRPGLPADEVEQLRGIVRDGYVGDERYIVLSPYAGLADDVVASAWGRQLRLDDVNDRRLPEFLELFAGGPTSPEKLFPCSGGEGTPLD
jgi:hypothetical protein